MPYVLQRAVKPCIFDDLQIVDVDPEDKHVGDQKSVPDAWMDNSKI